MFEEGERDMQRRMTDLEMKQRSTVDDRNLKAFVRRNHDDNVKRKADESSLDRLNQLQVDRLAHERARQSLEWESQFRREQR